MISARMKRDRVQSIMKANVRRLWAMKWLATFAALVEMPSSPLRLNRREMYPICRTRRKIQ